MNATSPSPEDPDTPFHDAPRELLDLACAFRPDWDRNDTWGALHAAHDAGWPPERILKRTAALLLRADSEPRELRDEAAATRPLPPSGPDVAARGLALARQALEQRKAS